MVRATCRPVNRRVKYVNAVCCAPFYPGMGLSANRKTPADNQPHVLCSLRVHRAIKGYCFTLAIREGASPNFLRRFPFHGKTVRNCAQISDPSVHQLEGQTLLFVRRCGSENRTYPRHLPIIGRGVDPDVRRLGKSRETGKTKQDQADKSDFGEGIWSDTYGYHNN